MVLWLWITPYWRAQKGNLEISWIFLLRENDEEGPDAGYDDPYPDPKIDFPEKKEKLQMTVDKLLWMFEKRQQSSSQVANPIFKGIETPPF